VRSSPSIICRINIIQEFEANVSQIGTPLSSSYLCLARTAVRVEGPGYLLLLKDLCVRMGSGHLVDAREQGKLGVDLDSHDSGLLLLRRS
jgi:hypothetical protein